MGNKRSRGNGLHVSALQSAIRILDAHVPLEQPAEPQGPEVHIPDAVVDLLEADILAHAHRGDVDPAAIPPNAAVGADVAHLEAIGIFERGEPAWHGPRRRVVARGGGLLIERLVGALVIEFLAKAVEPALLRAEAAGRGPGGGRLA